MVVVMLLFVGTEIYMMYKRTDRRIYGLVCFVFTLLFSAFVTLDTGDTFWLLAGVPLALWAGFLGYFLAPPVYHLLDTVFGSPLRK